MLLSRPQQHRFWREWSAACKAQGWTKANGWNDSQIDAERHLLLERAGFDSLTLVDPLTGFDRVLSELAVLTKPDDLNAQLIQQNMPRSRLLYAIESLRSKLGKGYCAAILQDRFGTTDLDRLSLDQLEQFRNTLSARQYAKSRQRLRQARSDAVGTRSTASQTSPSTASPYPF